MYNAIRKDEYGYLFGTAIGSGFGFDMYIFDGENIDKTVCFNHGGRLGDFLFKIEVDVNLTLEEDMPKLSAFEINKNNLLYCSFLNLLGDDEKLIIEDDFSSIRSLEIVKKDESIVLNFHDEKPDCFDQFTVGVKNTLSDLRSKVDQQGLDTKTRLWTFFSEASLALNEYEQQKVKKIKKSV